MNTVTIRFRAKRDRYATENFDLADGYRVPALTSAHVTFAERDAFATFFLSCRDARAVEARTRNMGVPRVVFADDTAWTITPVGNGFMADVTATIKVDSKGRAVTVVSA